MVSIFSECSISTATDSICVGEILQIHLGSRTTVVCSTVALVNELCDEKRFVKNPKGALEVRDPTSVLFRSGEILTPLWYSKSGMVYMMGYSL